MSAKSNLKEVDTKGRINLVQGDTVRRYGQLIIAFVMIGAMIGYLGWYTMYKADDDWLRGLADTMETLLTMGVGAALAIFGLGRTVGKK